MAHTPLESMLAEEEKYIQEIQDQDMQKVKWLKELLADRDMYKTQMKRLQYDLSAETDSRIRYQQSLDDQREQMNEYENNIERNAYVVVLIDGDGAIFLDSFLEKPAQGANEASQRLRQHIKSHLKSSGGKHELPIYARIYANLDNLANHIEKSGLVEDKNMVSRFSTHFTNSCAEFEFINVGPGKENADCKMRTMLDFHYNDPRCKRIYFVGCHDGGYSHDLKNYVGPLHEPKSRIVLVETTPALPLFKRMGFEILRFDNVFRNGPLPVEADSSNDLTKVPEWRRSDSDRAKPLTEVITPPRSPLIDFESLTPDVKTADVRPPDVKTPEMKKADVKTPDVKTLEVKTSGNGGTSITYSPSSYATAGGKTGFQNVDVALRTKKGEAKGINLNQDGHRIDNSVQNSSRDTHESFRQKCEKISPKVFCNAWYLTGACSRGTECEREHNVRLTASELECYRSKARTSACYSGRDCREVSCPLSHHCPHSPNCGRGKACKFRSLSVQRGEDWDWHYDKASMKIASIWHEGDPLPDDDGW